MTLEIEWTNFDKNSKFKSLISLVDAPSKIFSMNYCVIANSEVLSEVFFLNNY
jgi:hypothetical protein